MEMTEAEVFYRWAYRLLLALAQELLVQKNLLRENDNEWPRGQKWHEMVGTSQSVFCHMARDLAGIDHTDFIGALSRHLFELEDIALTVEERSKQRDEHPIEQFVRKLKGQIKLADAHRDMNRLTYELNAEDCRTLYKVAAEYAPREVMAEVREKLHGLGTEWDKVDSVYLRLKQDRADLIRALKSFMRCWESDGECSEPYEYAGWLLQRMKELEEAE